jgi:hypothetical protein
MSRKDPPPITQVRDRSPAAGKRRISRCRATNSKGQPCKSRVMNSSRYCFFHDPKRQAERRAAQSRGGKNSLARERPGQLDLPDVSLKSAHDVLDLVSDTISRLRRGEMDRAVCSTVGYLCQVVLKSIEQSEFEDRLDKIERELALQKD